MMKQLNKFARTRITLLLFTFFVGALFSNAQKSTEVSNLIELRSTARNANPGDVILLKDGDYSGKGIRILTSGTKEKPVIVKAKEHGKIFIKTLIKLEGDYIWLEGVSFIEEGKIDILGKGCRVTQCIWSDAKSNKWIRIIAGSSEIEIDHNTFQNKTSNKDFDRNCQLIQVMVQNRNERHHIHHNLFKNIAKGKTGNGFETLQINIEKNSLYLPSGVCNMIIEDNLFEKCNGEAEIISIKSNKNIIRRNTFRACMGALVIRLGNDNIVTQNYFLGAGESGSGGVRMQGTGQIIANNYFKDLGQFGLGMMDGTSDDYYVRVENAQILFNSFINCKKTMLIGINHPKYPIAMVPKDCRIAGNIFYAEDISSGTLIQFIKGDQPENWDWQTNIAVGNFAWKIDGVQDGDPHLKLQKNNLLYPTSKTPTLSITSNINEKIQFDLLGKKWEKERTVGAIQFPANSIENLPLTEDMVGANTLK